MINPRCNEVKDASGIRSFNIRSFRIPWMLIGLMLLVALILYLAKEVIDEQKEGPAVQHAETRFRPLHHCQEAATHYQEIGTRSGKREREGVELHDQGLQVCALPGLAPNEATKTPTGGKT